MKTIVAISTPLSTGGIGIVRLSGEDSLLIADKVFTVKSFSILNATPNVMYFGEFKGQSYSDNGYLVYFKAPHSFTGEDTVEIQLHGGVRLLEGVVDECIKHGAVMAERGEFTKRAFLNGKLKLSDAEGVIGMINADNAAALRANFRQMKGYLASDIEGLENQLLNLISSLEASLDYPEEMEDEVVPQIPLIVNEVKQKLDKLIKSSSTGRLVLNGINVALIGETNAGKSSLLNRLVGRDRAIVTEIAGTTRDVIETAIEYDGVKINFIDTAGIRESEDIVEVAGILKSKEIAHSADIIVNVLDITRGDKPYVEESDQIIFNAYNKCDLTDAYSKNKNNDFYISAKNGEGIDKLLKAIVDVCKRGEATSGELIISKRHLSALNETKNALDSVDLTMPIDCILIDLKEALKALGQITGSSANEDVIDAIFKNFCVGK